MPRIYKFLSVFLVALTFSLQAAFAFADDYSSASFVVKDPVITAGSEGSSSTNFGLNQSVGQTAAGSSTSSAFGLWSGFQYYFTARSNALTATAGDASVSLSWTTPTTYLGVSISGYEVGTGTTSGSYVFENVGLVNSFNKTSLTNGTPYFFIVKAKTTGGFFLVYSNEATATPTAGSTPGGGGGGPVTQTVLVQAYLGSRVIVLQNGQVVQDLPVSGAGQAQVTYTTGGSYSVYGKDLSGLTSPPVLLTNQTNVTLAPTVGLAQDKSSVSVFGTTQVSATLVLHVLGPSGFTFNQTLQAGNAGQYNLQLPTTTFPDGAFQLFLKGPSNTQSKILNFTVKNGKVDLPPVAFCGDFNRDSRVDLVDFSILIFWYGQNNPPKHIDCNRDNKVDLVDFSILMYNWTG